MSLALETNLHKCLSSEQQYFPHKNISFPMGHIFSPFRQQLFINKSNQSCDRKNLPFIHRFTSCNSQNLPPCIKHRSSTEKCKSCVRISLSSVVNWTLSSCPQHVSQSPLRLDAAPRSLPAPCASPSPAVLLSCVRAKFLPLTRPFSVF